MKRTVKVYRAESGAQHLFGSIGPKDSAMLTKPEDRVPLDTFTLFEASVDRARALASDFIVKRLRERPESLQILEDGGISATLKAPRS